MKKRISLALSLCLAVSMMNMPALAENATDNYISQLSAMVSEYDTGSYFGMISVKIGESEMSVDGETVPIDESGSAAYVENGRTMFPVRGIAEAMGADVSYDDQNEAVSIQSAEVSVQMVVGESRMTVNGEEQQLLTAPQIKNDRTMLPMRDVAEALDCEVEWDEDTQTATFTRPLQTKRLIVFSENVNKENAAATIQGDGFTILQFEKLSDAAEYMDKYGNLIKIEPDRIQTIDSLSWGVSKIGSERYYNQVSVCAGKATVAVIDTGIDYSHSAFNNRIIGGHDFWYNDDYCEDTDGHGTHVASTVLDVAGFNADIKIMPLKVFGSKDSTPDSMVAAAIEYAADNGANVINLSLGGMYKSSIEQDAVNKALAKNVAVFASAGNDNADLRYAAHSPGGLDGVITVSAINSNDNLASFSNYGEGKIDFAAPGVSINGAKNGGGYTYKSGTSMASPHVAGAYALVMSANPKLSVDKVTTALKSNAKSIGSSHYFGAGMIHLANLEKILPIELGESKLKIDMTALPDSINQGDNFGLRGTIKSNYPLTTVKGYIKKGGETVQSTTDTPNGTSLNVKNANLNNKLIFNNLASGNYVLLIEAMDSSGNKADISKEFSVYTEKEASSLKIDLTSYPSSINQGSAYGLRGSVTSNYNITEVRGYVINSSGNTVLSSADYPNSTSMDIRYAHLNNDLVFNNLSAGSYTMKVVAADESGKTKEWSTGFTVNGASSNVRTGVINIPSSWDNLSIRTGPSTDYTIIGSMNNGEKCRVFTGKAKNGWYYVEYNGVYGYAAGNRIDLQ